MRPRARRTGRFGSACSTIENSLQLMGMTMNEIHLYVEFQPRAEHEHNHGIAVLAGAHGLVVDPRTVSPQAASHLPAPVRVLHSTDDEPVAAWREHPDLAWVSNSGLEHTARLQDQWPALTWIPRLSVFKPQLRYELSRPFPGEGFRVYMPDTSAIHAYQVKGSEASLNASLRQAEHLGFQTLWLHALDAKQRRQGLDLELLERAQGFRGRLWLSGGAASEKHLANLAAQDGASAVIVPNAVAAGCTCERLRAALAGRPTKTAPLHFVAKGSCPAITRG